MDRQILQARLITFGASTSELADRLTPNPAGNNMAKQLARSGSSPALNYAESQFAESTKDFIHKLKVVLKELRETEVCLRLIQQANLCNDQQILANSILECNELIAIFVSSINTVRVNSNKESP